MPRPKHSRIVRIVRRAQATDARREVSADAPTENNAPAEIRIMHDSITRLDDANTSSRVSIVTIKSGKFVDATDRIAEDHTAENDLSVGSRRQIFAMSGALTQDMPIARMEAAQDLESRELRKVGNGVQSGRGKIREPRKEQKKLSHEREKGAIEASSESSQHNDRLPVRGARSRHIKQLPNMARDMKQRLSRTISPRTQSPSTGHDTQAHAESIADGTTSLSEEDAESAERQPSREMPPTPSMMSLANFKQRPRQPSILAMVQQSDLNADDIDLEDEPGMDDSILAGLRRSPSDGDAGSPEQNSSTPAQNSANSRKRKAIALDETSMPSPSPQASPTNQLQVNMQDAATETRQADGNEIANEHNLPNSPYLPRLSSATFIATSPLSSPQSSAHSEIDAVPVPKRRTRDRERNPKTAALKALLPKRLRTAPNEQRDTFEIYDSSELELQGTDGTAEEEDDDLDELSRPLRRRPNQITSKKSSKSKKGSSTKPNSKAKNRQPLGKSSAKTSNTTNKPPGSAAAKVTRTYGRQALEEVENGAAQQDSDGDASVVTDGENSIEVGRSGQVKRGRLSNELAQAKERFKKVDEWELDFESCDVGGGSSSPWR